MCYVVNLTNALPATIAYSPATLRRHHRHLSSHFLYYLIHPIRLIKPPHHHSRRKLHSLRHLASDDTQCPPLRISPPVPPSDSSLLSPPPSPATSDQSPPPPPDSVVTAAPPSPPVQVAPGPTNS
ncbi:hypothetical protein Tco_0698183 [Tanacetum coccineum]